MSSDSSSAWEDIQAKQYDGFGRCIYCGGVGGQEGLRDVHILPFAIGGNTWIRDASCGACAQAIDPVDTHLGRSVYGQFRIHANVQTRNPGKRPQILPATFRIDGKERTIQLPIEQHPFSLKLPLWGDAGFLRSSRIDEGFPETYWNFYHHAPQNLREILGLAPEQSLEIVHGGHVDERLFARAIAKIAYCHAVARYGLAGFRPLALPDIVLGRFAAISYFVGAALMNPPPPPLPSGYRHAIHFHELNARPLASGTFGSSLMLLIASVRLFADAAHERHGMPVYHVIVGVPRAQRISVKHPNPSTTRVIALATDSKRHDRRREEESDHALRSAL